MSAYQRYIMFFLLFVFFISEKDRQGKRFLKPQQLLKLHICIAMDRCVSQKATRLKGEVAFEHTWYRCLLHRGQTSDTSPLVPSPFLLTGISSNIHPARLISQVCISEHPGFHSSQTLRPQNHSSLREIIASHWPAQASCQRSSAALWECEPLPLVSPPKTDVLHWLQRLACLEIRVSRTSRGSDSGHSHCWWGACQGDWRLKEQGWSQHLLLLTFPSNMLPSHFLSWDFWPVFFLEKFPFPSLLHE